MRDKTPRAQRSTFGPSGLDSAYLAKKAMGDEGLLRAERQAKDPTLVVEFPLYSVYQPVELQAARDIDYLWITQNAREETMVYLHRVGETITWAQFESHQHELGEIWFVHMGKPPVMDKVPDYKVERVENYLLSRPEEDPFANENMMEEL